MRPQDDFTLPDFSIAEVVEIAPNLKLFFPAPAEIAASKLAFIMSPIGFKTLPVWRISRRGWEPIERTSPGAWRQ
jgi:hypothetical protein